MNQGSRWLPLVICFGIVALVGCRDEESFPVAPVNEVPRISGIVVTSVDGRVLGRWGNPQEPQSSDENFFVSSPVPNPARDQMELYYTLQRRAQVTIWLVPALGPFDSITEPGDPLDGIVGPPALPGSSNVRLYFDESLVPGQYSITINLNADDENAALPDGFYRLYARFNDVIVWRGLVVANGDGFFPG